MHHQVSQSHNEDKVRGSGMAAHLKGELIG